MIQVEKHGNKYAFYKTTCPECGCQFTFSPLDTKKVYMYGGMIDYRYVKCPECDYNIDEINWDI